MTGSLVKFKVSDIMDLPDDWASDCDVTFTDPPWGQGLVRMFETLHVKAGGKYRPENMIEGILEQLFCLAPPGPMFIEYGTKLEREVVTAGLRAGRKLSWVHHGIQLDKRPYIIVAFDTEMPAPLRPCEGWQFLEQFCRFYKGQTVFEPFAGHGQHTRRFVKRGMHVVASELNPGRAAKLQEYFKL